MNIDVAVKYLDDNAGDTSTSQCAKAVRLAMQAGGTIINPHPRDAKDYGAYLAINGFKKLDAKDYEPAKGDVAVIQNYDGGSTAGHTCMFDGAIWVSDFKQTDMWSGPGYRSKKPAYAIYRP